MHVLKTSCIEQGGIIYKSHYFGLFKLSQLLVTCTMAAVSLQPDKLFCLAIAWFVSIGLAIACFMSIGYLSRWYTLHLLVCDVLCLVK